jgi:hypothetical protein
LALNPSGKPVVAYYFGDADIGKSRPLSPFAPLMIVVFA